MPVFISLRNLLLFTFLFLISCRKDNDENVGTGISSATIAKANAQAPGTIEQNAFSIWGTCSDHPYLILGSRGICIPVGGIECDTNYLAAQQSSGQSATGMQFYGCFKGGSNAPDGSNEMAVFVCTDVTNWKGFEMGFVKTLSDNALKAYIQGPGGIYDWHLISIGDNGYHIFKCLVENNDHTKVDFYVDGNSVGTLQNTNPGANYWGGYYYFVGTTHRTSDRWNAGGQQIEMYNMTTF